VLGLLFLPSVVGMAARIASPLRGHNLFRQAHVAANIDAFLARGASLTPGTWNLDVPFRLFDFPAYQLLVAELCRHLSLPPLPAARALNILIFVLTLLVCGRVLERICRRETQRALALLFLAYAPLNVFYLSAPMVDGLAVLAASASLWGFVKWEDEHRALWYVVMVSTGVLSALVKNPVYLPTLLAILWCRFRARGIRGLMEADVVVLVAAVGASVVWFKLFSNVVNGQSAFLSPWEDEQYFGHLADRFGPANWGPVLVGLGLLGLNPLTLALAVYGAWLPARGARDGREILPGLLLGGAVTLLVFFSRCRVHSYYLLPFLFPLAFASSRGLWRLGAWWRAWRGGRSWWVLPAVTIAVTLLCSWRGAQTMSEDRPFLEPRGQWIQAHTDRHDFVVYVVVEAEGNWNPEYLYFARRQGFNLWRGRLTRSDLAELYVRFAGAYRRLFIFSADAEANAALDALGAPVVATDRRRRLYGFEPSWIWPASREKIIDRPQPGG